MMLPALSSASGVKGEKLLISTSPVISGMMQTAKSGISVPMVMTVWMRAVCKMPRCWTAKMTSRMTSPRKNVPLMRSVKSSLRNPRSAKVTDQVLILASGAKKIDSR